MDPDHHQALAAWPWALAAAATAVMVTTDYRPEDVLRAAAALGRLGSGPRELYRLLVSRLDAAHKELPEARRVRVARVGDSNVIKLGPLCDAVVYARTLHRNQVAAEARRARARELARITRQPIGNENEPEPRWQSRLDRDEDERRGSAWSPALRHLLAPRGEENVTVPSLGCATLLVTVESSGSRGLCWLSSRLRCMTRQPP